MRRLGRDDARRIAGRREIIDEYHASKYTTWFYGTGSNLTGSISFRMQVALHNHSATVTMTARATHSVRLTWRLKLMHHKTLAADDRLFTYPDVQGCSHNAQTCVAEEPYWGDGYNTLPYETSWKGYWEAFDTSLVINGERYPGSPHAQSDRATCYKTVRCKFI